MIVYIKNESNLTDPNTNANTAPIAWMWTAIYSGVHGWTGAAYLTNFFVGLIVPVAELVAWILYLFGDNSWFGWWSNGVGYYGAIIAQMVPPLFAMLQLGLGGS